MSVAEDVRIAPEAVVEWERCKHWIEAALERDGGHYGIDDIWTLISRGAATFWPGKRSAVVTQIWFFPKAKTLNIWLAGGDKHELLDEMQPHIDAFARAHGCSEMTVAGRLGWVRVMKPYGYEPIFTVIRRALS